MRAFIVRNAETIPLLKAVYTDPKDETYFDQAHWLMGSGESFHGEIVNSEFRFKDARLPSFSLPLSAVEVEV